MKTYRHKPFKCPECGCRLDSSSALFRNGLNESRPRPGDVTVCIECTGWLVYTGEGLKQLTQGEYALLDARVREELRVTKAAVLEVNRTSRRGGAGGPGVYQV